MVAALRSTSGSGRYVPSEWDITLGTVDSWTGDRPGLIFAHGSGVDALSFWEQRPVSKSLVRELAQSFTVSVADLGGEAWGNETHVSRIDSLDTYLQAPRWNCDTPLVLVGSSMGALGVLGRALNTPARVLGVICLIPALDLNDLHANNRGGIATALIDTAYGGSYDNTTDGPAHSPVMYAATLDPDLPIHLFTSSNDPLAVPATADAFMAARPQTVRHDMGPVGHGDDSLSGSVAAITEVALSFLGV